MSENGKSRQLLFTNFKAFLILTVVLGHFVQCMPDSNIRSFVMLYIYSFHMPAFLFVSGYFSKNVAKGSDTAFERYFIPFLYMSVIYIIVNLIISRSIYVRFIVPVFAAWYVLVLFYYKKLMKLLSRFKMQIVFPISVLLSMVIGLTPMFGSKLCLERFFAFLPFFLGGYCLSKERLDRIRQKVPVAAAYVGLLVIGVVFVIYVLNYHFDYNPMLCNTCYTAEGLDWKQGMVFRLYFTAMALFMTMLFLIVFPEKQLHFSYIGDNTMSVYALHCIPYLIIKRSGVLSTMNAIAGFTFCIVMAVLVVLILSIPKLNQLYMKGIHICGHLEKKYVLGFNE